MRSRPAKLRGWTAASLLVVLPVGFYSKFYDGPASNWVNNSLAGSFYEIFWILLIFLFFSNGKPWLIATSVLLITCILEFLQLWHPPFLEFVRSGFVGRTLIGSSFAWSDFPYYFLGSGVGWVWLACLRRAAQS